MMNFKHNNSLHNFDFVTNDAVNQRKGEKRIGFNYIKPKRPSQKKPLQLSANEQSRWPLMFD